jgi:SWI/SNF-related matrix-associated actin-dependent regulator 1 of chromatin subfamily A
MPSTELAYPFQKEAVARVAKGDQVYLGFDPGLGKSRTALDAARERKAKRILIICQASGRYVWENEAKKWYPGLPVVTIRNPADLGRLGDNGLVIITYGLLSIKESPFVSLIAKRAPYDMTILDEAAAVKNPGANRTKAILGKMLPKLGYVLPLSGTPAPNHAGELYPILRALHPKAIEGAAGQPMLQWQFEDTFCRVVSKRFGGGRDIRVIEGSKNLPELRRRLDGFMLRVRKEDVLADLPPIRYDVVPIGVDRQGIVNLPNVDPNTSDEELLKVLSGATGDEHVMRLRRLLGLAKAAPAVEYIDEFMQGLPLGKKLLVFAHHTDVIRALLTGLADWNPVVITGASSPAERRVAIDGFLTQNSCRMFVGNTQASGTGLTLVGPTCKCSDVVFVESSFSPSDNVQAACRVHRIGQREAVVARFLTAHGTIDDRIQSILARKALDFSNLFN